jgi:hypothetical protein
MSAPWPPPPDLESIQHLVREADIEGHIADGAPEDEYEPEEDELLAAIAHLPTSELVSATLLPIITDIWTNSFSLDEDALEQREPKLQLLASEIERFFGPEAEPQVRNA